MLNDERLVDPEKSPLVYLHLGIVLAALSLVGCSSGDPGPYGVFDDSVVEGLSYRTETHIGETDPFGRFSYESGETVTFSIGGIVLGRTSAKPIITPIDLVAGAQDEKDPAVTNITRLLMTLDEDNDPGNGITITPDLRTALSDVSVDFRQDSSIFEQDAAVLEILDIINGLHDAGPSQVQTLCGVAEAQDHLRNTLEMLEKNGYQKPIVSGGGQNGGGGGGGGSGGGGCG